jgi:hypothetical protein
VKIPTQCQPKFDPLPAPPFGTAQENLSYTNRHHPQNMDQLPLVRDTILKSGKLGDGIHDHH